MLRLNQGPRIPPLWSGRLSSQGKADAWQPCLREKNLLDAPTLRQDGCTNRLIGFGEAEGHEVKRGKGQKGQMGKRGNGEMGNGIRISGFGFSCLPRIPSPLPIFTFPLFPLLITYVRTRSSRNSRQPTQHLRRPGGAAGGEKRRHPVWRALWQTNAHEELQSERKGRRSRDTAPEHDTANMDARQRRMRVAQTSDFVIP